MSDFVGLDHNLSYPTAPASLQDCALTSVALYICSFNRYLWTEIELGPRNAKQSCLETISNKVPVPMKRLIEDRLKLVEKQLESAFEYLINFKIRGHTSTRYSLIYQCFVRGADATVDYDATARNLMICDGLTHEEKYMVACQCCLEEDVRRLWPYVSGNAELNEPDLMKFFLRRYWANRMKNKENEFPTHRDVAERLLHEGGSWSALTYMWSRSTLDEQLSDIDKIFGERRSRSYQLEDVEKLFTKLTRAQLNHLVQNRPLDAIIALSANQLYFEYLSSLWNHCKVFISGEQFCLLVKSLITEGFKCARHFIWSPSLIYGRNDFHCENYAHERLVLYEIWTSATPSLKSSFINSEVEKIFDEMNQLDEEMLISCHNHDVRFFYSLLADLDFERRNAIWLKYWMVIVVRARANVLHDFLKLCFKEEDIDQFVENELMSLNKTAKFMLYLLMRHEYDDVIEYTNMCARRTSEADGREYRQKLIVFLIKSFKLYGYKLSRVFELPNFVNCLSAFPDEPNQLMKLIFASASFQCMTTFQKEFREKGSTEITWKHDLFFNHWPRYLLNHDTDQDPELSNNRWKEFWSWCAVQPCNADVSAFKSNLPVDEIFVDQVVAAVQKLTGRLGGLEMKRSDKFSSSYCNVYEFEHVDEFLMWYFGDENPVRSYKAKFIANYKKWPRILAIFESKNECVVNDMLRWFFNGDMMEIDNFKCGVLVNEDAQ